MSNNFLIMKKDKAKQKIMNESITAPIYRVGNKLIECNSIDSVMETIRNAPIINSVPTFKYGVLDTMVREKYFNPIECGEHIAIVTFDGNKGYFSKPSMILGENDNYYFIVDENDTEDTVRRIKKSVSCFIEVD